MSAIKQDLRHRLAEWVASNIRGHQKALKSHGRASGITIYGIHDRGEKSFQIDPASVESIRIEVNDRLSKIAFYYTYEPLESMTRFMQRTQTLYRWLTCE